MATGWIRDYCVSLPHTTEEVQWEDHLLFKIGGKMFAILPLEPSKNLLSLKCSDEKFAELVEQPGIIPAPYLARAKWVAIQEEDALTRQELERLLREAYDLVLAKLPKKTRTALAG